MLYYFGVLEKIRNLEENGTWTENIPNNTKRHADACKNILLYQVFVPQNISQNGPVFSEL